MKKGIMAVLCLMLVIALLMACNSQDEEEGHAAEGVDVSLEESKEIELKTDPFALTVYAAGVSEEEFDERFRWALETEFPHADFHYMTNTPGNAIGDVIARGEIPDIIRIDIPGLKTYSDFGILMDLNPLVEKFDYDLQRFNPSYMQDIINAGQTGELFGLPVPPNFPRVLFYNIDLFDRFGEEYPTDGMNWDEVYELARKLSRTEGDVTYHGFVANLTSITRDNQYSLPVMHPREDGLSDFDMWQKIFNNYLRFYQIPNNEIGDGVGSYAEPFNEGYAAMYSGQYNLYAPISEEINWDMVSIPIDPDGPKRMGQRSPAYLTVTEQSEHKNEAFAAIMAMLSDEVQMNDSLNGILPTITNPEVLAALGKGNPIYENKNMGALSYYEPSDAPERRSPDVVAVSDTAQTVLIRQKFHDAAKGLKDVNTALREADEELRQMAEAERMNQ